MPGSSGSSSNESSKAKVTSAAANGGIFVRPVAVAGIFCPASDSDNKPPALPEKRRFSALVGDLRPCSSGGGSAAEEFNRRRQSWDIRQKEVPFGQALLRKTPRKTTAAPTSLSTRTDNEGCKALVSEKVSTSDKVLSKTGLSENSVAATKVCEADVFTNGPTSTPISEDSSKLNSSSKHTEKNQASSNSDKINHFGKNTSEKTKSELESEKLLSSDSVKAASSFLNSQANEKSNLPEKDSIETTASSENKLSKKVYGLIKRESKPELSNNQNDNTTGTKDITPNIRPTKKIYGLNRTPLKKDTDVHEKEFAETKLVAENRSSKKDVDATVKPSESKENAVIKPSVSPPKDFRTVRRTSDVIAAKIQNIFSNFQSDKPSQVTPRKSQILTKKETSSTLGKDSNKTLIETSKYSDSESHKDLPSVQKTKNISDNHPTKKSDSIDSDFSEKLKSQKKVSETKEKSFSSEKEFMSIKREKQVTAKTASSCNETEEILNNNPLFKVNYSHSPSVSKTDPSIGSLSSKQADKKIADIEGKMPAKKADQSSLDVSSSSLITNGEDDRKPADVTSYLCSTTGNNNKNSEAAKKQTVPMNVTVPTKARDQSTSNVSQSSVIKISNNDSSLSKTVENHLFSEKSCFSSSYSKTCVTSSSLQCSTYSSSTFSDTSLLKELHKDSRTASNGTKEVVETSKVEITKITPTTIPGVVPTVNVLFRTKSPQGNALRDENRKKVVIETNNSNAPLTSAVINPTNTNSESSSYNCVAESVKEALKTVEDVQKSLNSSPVTEKKHSIVNLKKEPLATVSLCSKVDGKELSFVSKNGSLNCDQDKIEPVKSKPTEVSKSENKSDLHAISNGSQSLSHSVASVSSLSSDSVFDATKDNSNLKRNMDISTKMSVVDLGDWNKKFQSSDIEPPRVPLRRRALRDSLPPSLPSRSVSRYGSLKRIEDAPRYIPRSPSHSTLPQRYSYTEMLSKVCSMGVLPLIEPINSKSCSSSSSQVSELWSELSEEQSTATHASEMLEAETSERMRLEKEVHELQNRYSQVQQRSDKMEMEMIENRMYRSPEINGDLSDDDETDGNSSLYKQKYERAIRDMEIMKRRMQQLQEEEMEQKAMMKKASEKRLAEALEDVEEERQIANQWKRKAQKLGAELQDLRLMLEEQMGRNGELEKKQRKFDAELSSAQEEIKKEKLSREKLMREKDQAISEKYQLEQDLQSAKLDSDLLHEKIAQLNRELDELTLSSKGEEEVTQLKRAKQELERKNRDQEEELEELAAQVQMLEQAKLRLEMSLEKVRQEHRREASVREEEIEEIRASFSKKIKNLEAQLESEQDERHQLMKQKHELERRIYELADQPPPQDPEIERRLRRDLKRTKALLRDAQSMLEHTREGQSSKTLIRQLKNQLEDSEFAKVTAVKARQAIETELQECQLQLEETTRVKNEAESRCLQLSREKSAIQTQLEEAEEEMAEVMKKYKSVVAQMSIDQKTLAEQNQQIAELETERQMLKDQLSEVSHKFEHLAGQSDDTHKVHWLDSKIRDLESKLELEQTTKTRLENQIARLKEQNDRSREECDSLRNKEMQAQEGVRRLQRQLRDLREDYSALQQKEADAYRKQHELEMALENTETDLQVTKNDLRLACQRIQDLQNALEDDLDSGTDVPDDSGSDSDDSFELSVLRNQSVTPVQRCESVASNLSYCTTEEIRSRTSSFSRELSAFSSRNDAEKDVNGLSGVSDRGLNVEQDENV